MLYNVELASAVQQSESVVCVCVCMKVKVAQSCPTLYDHMDYTVHGIEFSSPDSGVDSLSLLQGIFPTQESNPGLLHCRQMLYRLSHQGSYNKSRTPGYSFICGTQMLIKPDGHLGLTE